MKTYERMVLERTVFKGRVTSFERLSVFRNAEEHAQECMLPAVEGV
jgi:hypothetical protein